MPAETICISEPVYRVVARKAEARHQSPDRFVEEWLVRYLFPQHPHVEIVESRSGSRAVVKGTRVGVDVVVGYNHAGYTPEQIAAEILPHLTLAQIYDALSYYHDHIDEVETLLEANSIAAWQERLRQQMSDTAYARLTGQAVHA
ncbi:MAG: DUF433 domain-containing protein [Chloroflexota bacterium]|nr:DUF433 domain-containing protein [Chloroflexota bacterium]